MCQAGTKVKWEGNVIKSQQEGGGLNSRLYSTCEGRGSKKEGLYGWKVWWQK